MLALPKTTVYADLTCYGAPVSSGLWGGVKLSDLLKLAGMNESASSIDFVARDGYKVSLPIETALHPDIIIAYEKDSTPIGETYRLVIPQVNGNMWIAMITSINMSTATVSSSSSQPALTSFLTGPPKVPEQTQPTTQPTTAPTPTPTPTNISIANPAAPPLNATQPPAQQNLPAPASFPFEIVYAVIAASVIAAAATCFMVFRRRKM